MSTPPIDRFAPTTEARPPSPKLPAVSLCGMGAGHSSLSAATGMSERPGLLATSPSTSVSRNNEEGQSRKTYLISTVGRDILYGTGTIQDAIAKDKITLHEAQIYGLVEVTVTSYAPSGKQTEETMTLKYAIENGYMTPVEAIKAGHISAFQAIEGGFMTIEQAIKAELITLYQVIESGLMTAAQAIEANLMTIEQAIKASLMPIPEAVKAKHITADEAIRMTVALAIEAGLTESDAIELGHLSISQLVEAGLMTPDKVDEAKQITVLQANKDRSTTQYQSQYKK